MKRSGNWSLANGDNKVVTKSSFLSVTIPEVEEASVWGSPDLIALFKVKSLAARLAWEGKLADISDVIEQSLS